MQGAANAKLKASGAEKAKVFSCSFRIRHINKLASTLTYVHGPGNNALHFTQHLTYLLCRSMLSKLKMSFTARSIASGRALASSGSRYGNYVKQKILNTSELQ